MPNVEIGVLDDALKLIVTDAEGLANAARDMGGMIRGLEHLELVLSHLITARKLFTLVGPARNRDLQTDLNTIGEHMDKVHEYVLKRNVTSGVVACMDALRIISARYRSHNPDR